MKEEIIKKAINLLNDNSNIPFNLLDKYDDSLEKIELYELKKMNTDITIDYQNYVTKLKVSFAPFFDDDTNRVIRMGCNLDNYDIFRINNSTPKEEIITIMSDNNYELKEDDIISLEFYYDGITINVYLEDNKAKYALIEVYAKYLGRYI